MSKDFEKWWNESGIESASIFETGAAKKGWNARQPEIDALKAENERLRSQLEHRELSVEERVAQAKENNRDLVHWESNDPDAWDEAMKQDEILRTTSTWASRPFAERFAEVVRRVRAILPEASTPP